MQPWTSDWPDGDRISQEQANDYLARCVRENLATLLPKFGLGRGYCAVTGIEIGRFALIHRIGQIDQNDLQVSISKVTSWIEAREDLPISVIRLGDVVFLPLIGFGELFGFVIIFDFPANLDIKQLDATWQPATKEIAAFGFARRVNALAIPLSTQADTVDNEIQELEFLDQVAANTTLSFGADGVVIRLFDAEAGVLRTAAQAGDLKPTQVAERRPGEALSGSVYSCANNMWGLAEIGPQVKSRGCPIPEDSVSFFREHGIRAVLCARLDDPYPEHRAVPFGTIAYHFRRANSFSWRDVALFVGFARRVADMLGLIRQSNRLSEKSRILEIQAPVFTQAELAHLLVHDLSHKVLAVEGEAIELQDQVKKELKRHRDTLSAEIVGRFTKFQESMNLLKKQIIDLRSVGRLQDRDDALLADTRFNIHNTIDSTVDAMRSALDRQKIEARVDIPAELHLFGPIKVFEHVVLNLIINTIDAARARTSQRPMTIHFSAIGDSAGVRIRVWDTGPGVDMSKFDSHEDVFKVGKTTKPRGTGMGLPVARTLLDRYFRGSLRLLVPKSALFEISFRPQSQG